MSGRFILSLSLYLSLSLSLCLSSFLGRGFGIQALHFPRCWCRTKSRRCATRQAARVTRSKQCSTMMNHMYLHYAGVPVYSHVFMSSAGPVISDSKTWFLLMKHPSCSNQTVCGLNHAIKLVGDDLGIWPAQNYFACQNHLSKAVELSLQRGKVNSREIYYPWNLPMVPNGKK